MKKYIAICILSIAAMGSDAFAGPYARFGLGGANVRLNLTQDKVQTAEQSRTLTLRDVAQIINAQVQGRVLDAKGPMDFGGRRVYFIRWQTNGGSIIDFEVDAESGQILKRSGG